MSFGMTFATPFATMLLIFCQQRYGNLASFRPPGSSQFPHCFLIKNSYFFKMPSLTSLLSPKGSISGPPSKSDEVKSAQISTKWCQNVQKSIRCTVAAGTRLIPMGAKMLPEIDMWCQNIEKNQPLVMCSACSLVHKNET